jgi:hypothetical protein
MFIPKILINKKFQDNEDVINCFINETTKECIVDNIIYSVIKKNNNEYTIMAMYNEPNNSQYHPYMYILNIKGPLKDILTFSRKEQGSSNRLNFKLNDMTIEEMKELLGLFFQRDGKVSIGSIEYIKTDKVINAINIEDNNHIYTLVVDNYMYNFIRLFIRNTHQYAINNIK